MKCRACGADADRVISSRDSMTGQAVRRRRLCRCGARWSTLELPVVWLDVLAALAEMPPVKKWNRPRAVDFGRERG